jgi:hypothetical protein
MNSFATELCVRSDVIRLIRARVPPAIRRISQNNSQKNYKNRRLLLLLILLHGMAVFALENVWNLMVIIWKGENEQIQIMMLYINYPITQLPFVFYFSFQCSRILSKEIRYRNCIKKNYAQINYTEWLASDNNIEVFFPCFQWTKLIWQFRFISSEINLLLILAFSIVWNTGNIFASASNKGLKGIIGIQLVCNCRRECITTEWGTR